MKRLVVLCLLLLALAVSAQEVKKDPPKLTDDEKVAIRLEAKDFVIAAQRTQILRTQLAEAMAQQQQLDAALRGKLAKLREKYKAPEKDWDFNYDTGEFVPARPAPPAQ